MSWKNLWRWPSTRRNYCWPSWTFINPFVICNAYLLKFYTNMTIHTNLLVLNTWSLLGWYEIRFSLMFLTHSRSNNNRDISKKHNAQNIDIILKLRYRWDEDGMGLPIFELFCFFFFCTYLWVPSPLLIAPQKFNLSYI